MDTSRRFHCCFLPPLSPIAHPISTGISLSRYHHRRVHEPLPKPLPQPPPIPKPLPLNRKCAVISAHYEMGDVFDNLIISLCKFTTLLSSTEVFLYSKLILGEQQLSVFILQTKGCILYAKRNYSYIYRDSFL